METQVVSLCITFKLVMEVNGELSYLNCLNMNDYWTQTMSVIKQITAIRLQPKSNFYF